MDDALAVLTHRQIREVMSAEIEASWTPEVRERLRTNAGDNRIYGIWRQTFGTGLFDPLRQFVDPTRASVDVGALLGQYSLTLAAWSTRCLCIEPLRQYEFMAHTLPPNCVWRRVAAGEHSETATLRSPQWADGGVEFGLSSLVQNEWPAAKAVIAQPVEVRRLDLIIPEALGDELIGFIKVDVEGNEINVLRGAMGTLRRHRPNVLIETADVPAVRELMAQWGYRGLFFYRRRLFDLAQYCENIHRAPEHIWSAERSDRFNPDLVMSDLYFIPT
jgi:FkbM family methyltransferase